MSSSEIATPSLAGDRRERKIAAVLLALIATLIVIYTVCAWIVGPSMYADQGKGFLALRYWLQGGPFNVYPVPDPADIARDQPFFVGWWSPGQYLVPGVFKVMGLDLGHSMTIVLFLSSVSAFVGLYHLYRQWNFPLLSIAVTFLVFVTGRLFTHQFDIYGGGEVILTAISPWWFLLLLRMRNFSPLGAEACVLAGAIVLTVAKLSGLVLVLASVAALELDDLWSTRRWRWARWTAMGAALAVFAGLFQFFWLSRGEAPTSTDALGLSVERGMTHFISSVVACFTNVLSLGDFAVAVAARPGHVLIAVDGTYQIYLALAIPVLLVAYVVTKQAARSRPDYVRFAALLAVVYCIGMAMIYLRGSEISLEDRHFRQVGMVLAIGVVHAVMQWRRPSMLAAVAFALVLSAYGVGSWAYKLHTNMISAKGDEGFRHMFLKQDELDFIHAKIDTPVKGSSLVVVQAAEMQLEFHHRRTFEIPAPYIPLDVIPRRIRYHGQVDHIGVLMKNVMVRDGKADAILAGFKDYALDRWNRRQVGDFTYFSQDRPNAQ
jgi:hypothetical protein